MTLTFQSHIDVIGYVTVDSPQAISYLLFQTVFRSDAPFSHNTYTLQTDYRQTTDGRNTVA